ncbi:MAG TPA: CopD family protein [Stellaceae bacterium]|nr:CopD family protein [Stellaceae bacterium]
MILPLILHVLAATLWVGGMFFAHVMLRPALQPLDGPTRLGVWRRVLRRFLPAVWVVIGVLLLSGYVMVFLGFGGFKGVGIYVHIMQGLGIIMILAFAHLFFSPWKRFQRALDAQDNDGAAASLAQIRAIVTFNLILGLIVVAVGASGRYWGIG